MSDDRHPNERLADSPEPDPVDANATEPPERPQSRGVTRRALLGGTALGAGLLAYTSDYEDGGVTHSIARAATVPDEPLITVGPESDPVGYIFESNGDWVFKHEASGNEFFYNSTDDRWETNQELNVPALATDKIGSGGGITSTDITDLEGPGNQVNGSNELETDYETPQEVSGSRSIGTWETNNTGNPLVVNVVIAVGSGNLSSNDAIRYQGHVNTSQSENRYSEDSAQSSDGNKNLAITIPLSVPNGAEYKLSEEVDDSTSAVVVNWYEQQVGA